MFTVCLIAGWTYLDCESAWSEQRVFTNMAVKQLGNHSVVKEIEENLNELKPDGPDLRGVYSMFLLDKISRVNRGEACVKIFYCKQNIIRVISFSNCVRKVFSILLSVLIHFLTYSKENICLRNHS